MKVALVGNQNVGKSSIFNAFCGLSQNVGNWPGVTIEKKEGTLKNSDIKVIDLPGTYSLNPYTPEENITTNYILEEELDLIINVVDATNLERNLYLTSQLLNIDIPIVVVLNMTDLLESKGIKIDINNLKQSLKCDVFMVSSKTKEGFNELITFIRNKKFKSNQRLVIYDNYLEEKLKNINIIKMFDILKNSKEIEKYFKNKYDSEFEEYVINMHYKCIKSITKKSLKNINKKNITQLIDKILLNKYFGIPIFIIIMSLIYLMAISIFGGFISNILDKILLSIEQLISNFTKSMGISEWLISLINEGIISGVGSVLRFLPSLFILFLCVNILENSGYMSRIAILLDGFFYKIGLSGKSLIPFIIGSGCAVPGILSARTIKEKKERERTMALTYLIPCSAKLPIIVLFSSAFFPNHQGLMAIILYFLSISLIMAISFISSKIFHTKEQNNKFLSELPNYSFPNFYYILQDTFQKIFDFVKRAGTVIVLCSIIVWALGHLSIRKGFTYNLLDSILADFGRTISFVFFPILKVNSWEASVSIIQGIIAKEQVVASMEIITKLNGSKDMFLSGPFSFFTPSTAMAFCIFNLFSCPCVSTLITLKNELHSTKKVLLIVVMQTLVAYVLACLISMIG